MNKLDNPLPEIDKKACEYAVLEFEINQILREFDYATDTNENDDKTLDYIYRMLNIVHNQVKMSKIKFKKMENDLRNAEKRAEMYKEEVEYYESKFDTTSSMDSEWNDSIDEREFNAHNLDFSRTPGHTEIERKSQIFKQHEEGQEHFGHQNQEEGSNQEILDMLGLNRQSIQNHPTHPQIKKTNGKFSFYPMPFMYSHNPITERYFKSYPSFKINELPNQNTND
jgi:hypothetical protein